MVAAGKTPGGDSDIGALWKKALEEYNKTAEIKLREKTSWDTDEMRKRQDKALGRFKEKRHPGDCIDRARSALAKISEFARVASKTIGSLASSVFPPAPVIAEVLVYVLEACDDVSTKYDKVADFYETIALFFERLSMLERKLPEERAFPVQLTRVFAAALQISGIAQKFYKEGRVKAFGKALAKRDNGLGEAYDELSKQMAAFESCVIMATLGITTDTHADTKALVSMASMHTAMLWQIDTKVDNLGRGIAAVIVQQLEQLSLAAARIQPPNSQTAAAAAEAEETTRTKRGGNLEATAAGQDLGTRKCVALEYLTKWLAPRAQGALKQRLTEMAHDYIEGTCTWIESNQNFVHFIDLKDDNDTVKLLVIRGRPGTGKSMMSFHIYGRLVSRFSVGPGAAREAAVGYFTFSRGSKDNRSLRDMVCYCATQIAQQDETYRNQLMASMQKATWKSKTPTCCGGPRCDGRCWKSLIADPFSGADSGRWLFLVLDCVDQCDTAVRLDLLRHLRQAADVRARIRVVMTAAADRGTLLNDAVSLSTEISLHIDDNELVPGLKADLKTFAEMRIRDLPRLSGLPEKRKKDIVDVVCNKADGFRYVDYTLRRLKSGRRLKTELPGNTQAIYKELFDKCSNRRSQLEIVQLRCLFTWLAYAPERCTLAATKRLLEIVKDWHPTDPTDEMAEQGIELDEELDGSLSMLVSVFSNYTRPETIPSANDSSQQDDDEDLYNLVGFSAFSLREYCRSMSSSVDKSVFTTKISGRVLMFRMIASCLVMDSAVGPGENGLVSYAAEAWWDYLRHGDQEEIIDEDVEAVVEGLALILSGANPALQRMEQSVGIADPVPSILGNNELVITENSETICRWARRAKQLDKVQFSELGRDFIHDVSEAPRQVLLYLARKHAGSWLNAEYPGEAYHSFRLAEQAFHGAGYNEETQGPSKGKIDTASGDRIREESFAMVAYDFAKWEVTAKAQKCLSMALRYRGFYESAIAAAEKGFESATAEEKFDLNNRIGRTYSGWSEDLGDSSTVSAASRLELALDYFNAALDNKSDLVDNKVAKTKLIQTYQLKAKAEMRLRYPMAAMTSVEAATELGRELGDGSDAVVYFSDIVEGFGDNSLRWHMISKLLNNVNKAQLAARYPSKTHKLIQEAAYHSGSEARLLAMYEEAIRVLDEAGDPFSGSVRGWLALFERRVLHDIKSAKKRLYEVLDNPPLGAIGWITPASWQLSDILLEEFRLGTSLETKETAHEEMERLFALVTELQGPDFQPEQSQISIPLSIMRRRLGPTTSFYASANATFRGCIDTLTDDMSSNDAPSFQMLAKVLSLLPGLRWDAEVASSCQFYIIDLVVHEAELSSEVSSIPPSSPRGADVNTPGSGPPMATPQYGPTPNYYPPRRHNEVYKASFFNAIPRNQSAFHASPGPLPRQSPMAFAPVQTHAAGPRAYGSPSYANMPLGQASSFYPSSVLGVPVAAGLQMSDGMQTAPQPAPIISSSSTNPSIGAYYIPPPAPGITSRAGAALPANGNTPGEPDKGFQPPPAGIFEEANEHTRPLPPPRPRPPPLPSHLPLGVEVLPMPPFPASRPPPQPPRKLAEGPPKKVPAPPPPPSPPPPPLSAAERMLITAPPRPMLHEPDWLEHQQFRDPTRLDISKEALWQAGGKPNAPAPAGKKSFDLNPGWAVVCSSCRKQLHPRASPYHIKRSFLCVFCTNTALCEPCLLRIQASSTDLLAPCPEGHHYVDTPASGWRGVRDGTLIFEYGQIDFGRWLQGLEDRWKAAWETSWAEPRP